LDKVSYKRIADKRNKNQYIMAEELLNSVGLPLNREIEINELAKFENKLDVQIIVFSQPFQDKCIYTGSLERVKKLFLYHTEGHFDLITSITGFLSRSYFCTKCKVCYDGPKKHTCVSYCKTCESENCFSEGDFSCLKCFQICRNLDCFNRHIAIPERGEDEEECILEGLEDKNLCNSFFQCKKCKITYRKKEEKDHICGERKCSNCAKKVKGPHLCYMRSVPPSKTNGSFIFFDFETITVDRQECSDGYKNKPKPDCILCKKAGSECLTCSKCLNCNDRSCHTLKHVVNYVVSQTVCPFCEKNEMTPEALCKHCGSKCRACYKAYKKSKQKYDCRKCWYQCGKREVIFSGEKSVSDFTNYLMTPQNKVRTIIAHNGRGFDFVLILEELMANYYVNVKTIYSGAKIMSLYIPENRLSFRDSLCFLPMALKKIPASFGLKCTKGDFPHFFNRPENYDYEGPIPDKSHYGYNSMSTAGREEFLIWYNSQKNKKIIFKDEILKYCRADVTVLRECCMEFRRLILEITVTSKETDPETGLINYVGAIDAFHSTTLAGLCLNVFRCKFLPETYIELPTVPENSNVDPSENSDEIGFNEADYLCSTPTSDKSENMDIEEDCVGEEGFDLSYSEAKDSTSKQNKKKKNIKKVFDKSPIGLIPPGGYSYEDQFSYKSILWLELFCYRNDVKIKHAMNGGEFRVPDTNYRLDGYISESHTALEFYGDYFHGCPNHTAKVKGLIAGLSAKQRYAMTVEKIVLLKNKGFKVIEMWECQFDWELKHLTPDEIFYLKNLDLTERLSIRDGLYGGRTNAYKLYAKVLLELYEIIKFLDVNSLYPEALKYGVFPEGHGTVITQEFKENVGQYFGFIKVRVLPPRNLYHPVLPQKIGGKLKFTLCRLCALNLNFKLCTCSDENRSFVGTYCTLELDLAIENGYKVVKIFEVLHWDKRIQYCPVKKSGGLFTKYVNTFLKLKTEASGYPSWCNTDADKEEFIKQFYEKEGISLDKDNIKYNAGLRLIAKAFLNNFWGRLGLRENLPRTHFAKTVENFFEIVNNSAYVVNDFQIVNDSTVALVYENHADMKKTDVTTNVALAAFTTCQGRIHLYKYMKLLGERLLYTDTDCIIFMANSLNPHLDPPVGHYLGDLTSELQPGEFIVEFVSSGPKSYSFLTNRGRQVCHLRGFTLNYKNSRLINFEVMRDMVLNQKIQNNPYLKTVATVNENKITRNKFTNNIYNSIEIKQYKTVYDKRIILPDLSTVPFGYDFSHSLQSSSGFLTSE